MERSALYIISQCIRIKNEKTAFALGLFDVSLNTFACGNNGWNADAVPPKQFVIVTGSGSVSVSGDLM
ncbi:hypothetical protein ABIX03_003792 [Escherichia coli]|uniref:Uncharacterized protein n=1 Tax=Escherichia coli TaxID=562 RepID=A0A1W1EMG3_ECOLX|nr:hypothetical protein [Escherichia coli]SJK83523.1 hypothetical protein BQ8769_141 [Escherichia coli]